jgi:hypothetical protein
MTAPRRRWAVALAGCAAAAAAGTALAAPSAHTRSSAPAFAIAGRLTGRLVPGGRVAIDLRLANRRRVPLVVTRVSVAIASVTGRRGCRRNVFRAVAFRGRYPIRLRARGTSTLSGLGYPRRWWPRVEMADTLANQDACRGARIALAFSGSARRLS